MKEKTNTKKDFEENYKEVNIKAILHSCFIFIVLLEILLITAMKNFLVKAKKVVLIKDSIFDYMFIETVVCILTLP